MAMSHQFTLPLLSSPSYKTDDFFVCASNYEAYALLAKDAEWPHFCSIIYGPEGAGKTHLGELFREKAGAAFFSLETSLEKIPDTPLILDNVDLQTGLNSAAEEVFFHLYNTVKSKGKRLLILTNSSPSDWAIRLPDLKSRLRSSTLIKLDFPNDALLMNMYAKLFADYQLTIPPSIIPYLVKTIPRTFKAVLKTVEALSESSLRLQRPITIPFIRQVLGA